MEKLHLLALLRRSIGVQRDRGNAILPLVLLFLVAVFLTSLLMGSTGSAATLRSFQSPISPISPVSTATSPPEPVAGPVTTPTPQSPALAVPPSAVSTQVLWIVIGLVVVGTFVVGLVFFQKRRR
jgi:hypothetical protein